jgi:hypothetical protein
MDGDWRLVMADETKLLVSLHTPYCLSTPVPATSDFFYDNVFSPPKQQQQQQQEQQ